MQEKRVHTSDNTVIVNGIGKSFGAVDALRDVSLEVGRGEVVALLGPNGAGKTTMVDILSTLTRPDRGHASIAGFDVVSEAAIVRRSIMLTGQQVALDEILTGRENLVLFGRLQGLSKSNARSRAEELVREFDLVDAADRRVGTYSGGMRRRIDIACGLVVRPEVVFLDEPTTGLDPRSRQTIWDLVAGFKNLGIATLLTTQYLEEADALSDRIIVIDHGVIVAEGTADQLKERTGGSYCEIVPRDLHDLPAIAEALGSLLPEENRAALTNTADRIAIPAPGGANTLVEALSRLDTANIELIDIALRRPSLDEVFLSLTKDSASTPVPDEPVVGEQPVDIPVVAPNGSDGAKHRTSGRGRSWLASHSRASIMLVTLVVTCANLLIAASLVITQKDSRPGDRSAANTSVSPASVQAGPPPGSAPSTPQLSLPSEPLPTPVPRRRAVCDAFGHDAATARARVCRRAACSSRPRGCLSPGGTDRVTSGGARFNSTGTDLVTAGSATGPSPSNSEPVAGRIAMSTGVAREQARPATDVVVTTALAAARPKPSPFGQWWILTTRLVAPTVRNGEVLSAVVTSVVFTAGWYIPLNHIMGAVSGMSSYAQYLMPLIALQGIAFASVTGALRAATDAVKGVNRRFQSMPIGPLTPLAARMSASVYRCAVGTAAALISGHVIGFRFYRDLEYTVGFCLLLLLIGVVLSFLADLLGTNSKNPEATTQLLLLPQLIFGLLSVGIQPVERFPHWTQPIVRNQPISQFVYALRALAGDKTPAAGSVTWSVVGPSLAWLVGAMTIMVPLSVIVLRRRP